MAGENLVVLRFAVDNAGAITGIERVGAVSGETAAKIKLSNDEVVASNEKAGLSFSGVAEKAGASKTALLGGMRGMVAAVAAYAGYEGIKGMVKSAADWQTQMAVMNRSLTNAHINSKGAAANVADVTEKLSQKGGFSAPDQMAGMAQFVTQTDSVNKALKMNIATMDLARLTNKPYATSMRLVQTAMAGTPGRLSRIVGTIIPVTKYTEGLTSAWKAAYPNQYKHLQMLNKQATAQEIYRKIMAKAGGQMTAYSKTTTGAMSNAKNAIDNAGRQIGTVLLPYVTKLAQWLGKNLPTALNFLVKSIKLYSQYIQVTWGNVIKFIKTNQTFHAVLRTIGAVFVWVGVTARNLAVFLAGGAVSAFGAVKVAIHAVKVAVNAVQVAFNKTWGALKSVGKWLSGAFTTIWSGVGSAIHKVLAPLLTMYNLAKSVTGFVFGSGTAKQNRQQRANMATPSGGRFGPVTGSAHQSALRGQVRSLSSIGTRKTDVNSQATSTAAMGGGTQVIELHHTTKLGSRAITTEVARYALRANALSGAYTAVS